jgi:hypothetical protein
MNRNRLTRIVFPCFLLTLSLLAFGCQVNPPTPTRESETEVPTDMPETPAPEEKILFIGTEKIKCIGVGPQECYLMKENPDDEWHTFHDSIDGFEWKIGYIFKLRVAVHQVENPPADAASLRYELIEVVDKVETSVQPEGTETYIRIGKPTEGAALDANKPIVVRGMGAGLFEGNVVVKIVDADGVELALQPTILQSPEVGTGGEDPWEVEILLSVAEL